MTGIELAAVIQRGKPQITSSNRGRTSAARRVEITLSPQSGPTASANPTTNLSFVRHKTNFCVMWGLW